MLIINVANFPDNATEDELKTLFEQYGPVKEVKAIEDRITKKSKSKSN